MSILTKGIIPSVYNNYKILQDGQSSQQIGAVHRYQYNDERVQFLKEIKCLVDI